MRRGVALAACALALALAAAAGAQSVRLPPKGKLANRSPQTLYSDTTATASVTTGERDGSTYTMPANTLNANGQALQITAAWQKAVNTNAGVAKLYINGVVMMNITNTASNDTVLTQFEMVRTSATTATYQGRTMTPNGAYVGHRGANFNLPTGSPIVIKISASGAVANGDMSTNYLRVVWCPN